ncbi:PKD domain-containing protein [Microscilla marina]|uniref:PKD domain protein n=1 Tax=Microscilla marina ATCC 23134 TaxID=313606 RepID=A1ZTH8_MICM2|nr:PKD domain-containing protein [Microscilla marina]EAY26238.1 PKD domain protein [Microscilla marina ATCC 23134]
MKTFTLFCVLLWCLAQPSYAQTQLRGRGTSFVITTLAATTTTSTPTYIEEEESASVGEESTFADPVAVIPATLTTACNSGKPVELSPIIISEQSPGSFAVGKGTLVLAFDHPDFVISKLPRVTVTGAPGDFLAPTVKLKSGKLYIDYDFVGTTKVGGIVLSGLEVRSNSKNKGIVAQLKPLSGYAHFTGLTTSAVFATVQGINATTSSALPAPTNIGGFGVVCAGGNGFTYTADPVPDVTGYLWKLPVGFLANNDPHAIQVSADQYYTADNVITLDVATSASVGNKLLQVKSVNDCKISTTARSKTIRVAAPPNPKVSLPATSFPDNDFSPVNITVTNSPAGGIGALRGDGVIGNKLYPGLLFPGTGYKVYYDYAINNCTVTASTSFSVYDADAVVLGLATSYCSNVVTSRAVTIANLSSALGAKLYSPTNRVAPLNLLPLGGNNYRYTFSGQDLYKRYGAGAYRFEVTQAGASVPIKVSFQITTPPAQSITGGTGAQVCGDGSSIYNYSSSIAATTDEFEWSAPAGGATFVGGIHRQATASVVWSGGTPTGTSKILRLAQTRNGCTTITDYAVKVFALPAPGIVGDLTPCAGETVTYTLDQVGNASGGTYSWQVANGQIVGASNQAQITIKWGNANGSLKVTQNLNGCTKSAEVAIIIKALPTLSIEGFNAKRSYCVGDATPVVLTPVFGGTAALPADYLTTGNFEIKRIAGNKPASASFVRLVAQGGALTDRWLPAFPIIGSGEAAIPTDANTNELNLNAGQYLIRYTYTNANGCVNHSAAYAITIQPLPTLSFTGLAAEYCSNDSPVMLSAFKNGVLTPLLPGFIARNTATGEEKALGGNLLNPADFTAGKYELFLALASTGSTGCANTSSRDTTVYFEVIDPPASVQVVAERRWNEDTLRFTAVAGTLVSSWAWNFGNLIATTASVSYPVSPDKQGSIPLLNYSLNATNASGCSEQISQAFKVDFDFAGQYIVGKGESYPTRFTDLSLVVGDSIQAYVWNFGDGATSNTQNPVHQYQRPGTYEVSLTIRTSVAAYTLHRRIDIFPLIKVTETTPYYSSFENTAGGWLTHGTIAKESTTEGSSWQLVNDAWQMPDGYAHHEQSYVASPAFDISELTRPVLSFDYEICTDVGADGLVLLYTLDDGKTWKRLGAVGQGIAWYNTTPILGKPGDRFTTSNGDAQGWSGKFKGWRTARIALDRAISNLPAAAANPNIIRFRFAFGSNPDNPPGSTYQGITFDNFELRNRNRVALLEYFINQGIANAAIKSTQLAQVMSASSNSEIVSIHYHTSFPTIDEFNTENSKDPSARTLHYGLRNVPATVVNGRVKDSLSTAQLKDSLLKETLLPAAFAITIDPMQWQNKQLKISAKITALTAFERPVVFHAVIVDSSRVASSTGETYAQVLRKMLPDAAGIFRGSVWQKGEVQTFGFSYNAGPTTTKSRNLKVLVFVADYQSRGIYQVATANVPAQAKRDVDESTVTGLNKQPKPNATGLLAYPNPVRQEVTLALPKGLTPSPDIRWQVMSVLGQVIKQGHWASRTHQHQIYLTDVPDGVYIVRVYDATSPERNSFEVKVKKIK